MNSIRNLFFLLALRRKLDELNIRPEDVADIKIKGNDAIVRLNQFMKYIEIEVEVRE